MPGKRSKSKERERKRKYREQMSEEKKEREKQMLKNRMKKKRQEISESKKDRETREKKTETLTSTLWGPGLLFGETELYKRHKRMDRERIKEKRASFTSEEIEAENLGAKLRMRKIRENQTDEKRQAQRQKSKERMRNLRMKRKMQESSDESMDASPDIVKRLNDYYRNEKEKNVREAIEEVIENEGSTLEDCTCDIDINCPYCTAQNEDEKYLYSIITKEESEKFAKEELEEYKIMKKIERKERRKALVHKFKKPLPPLPVRELSEYEKIREDIIAQRNQEWQVYEKEWEKKWQESEK